jgi:hypothetical protein
VFNVELLEQAKGFKHQIDERIGKFLKETQFPSEERRQEILKLDTVTELRTALDCKKITSVELVLTYLY